jgi:co-chaperonin GroES (HSP10)
MSDATTSRKMRGVRLGGGKKVSEAVLAEHFPDIDPGVTVFGDRVLVQLALPKAQTSGGIYKPDETQELDKWRAQLGKIVHMGPVAYKDRRTMDDWPEGAWVAVGDYVRVPQYGGDKWEIKRNGTSALFVIFQDTDVIGTVHGNPLDHMTE